MSDSNQCTHTFANKIINNNITGPTEELNLDPAAFDLDQLDDEEYGIPVICEPQSLEAILNEPDEPDDLDHYSFSEELDNLPNGLFLGANSGSETQSLSSQRSPSNHRLATTQASETLSVSSSKGTRGPRGARGEARRVSTGILRHVLLKGISVQLASAAERSDAGTATAVAIGAVVGVGTSRGLALVFDGRQALRWVLHTPPHHRDHGSVSCLSFNADSSRLLVGYARGLIVMFDLGNGNVLRALTDVHPPNTAVLCLKFTDVPNLALCSDSGGSVFELTFTRTLGIRGCDTRCLFSGSRGEVTTMVPLLLTGIRHPLQGLVITAMATLTKVIVVCVRPKLRVLLVRPLIGGCGALPLLAWQLVPIHNVMDPILACAKGDTIFFYQVSIDAGGHISVGTVQKMSVGYSLLACHWLNPWSLALLDGSERLHLVDVLANEQLEGCDLSSLGLVYESSHFKAIFTGGNVSKAMARAGEKACYNTVVSSGGQLLVVGGKTLHALTIRPWADRLNYLVNQGKYAVALSVALSFIDDPKTVTGVRGSKERKRQAARAHAICILNKYIDKMAAPQDDIPTIVQYCVTLKATDVLFARVWDSLYLDVKLKAVYLSALEPYILSEQLTAIPPIILQQLVLTYEQAGKLQALEACLLHVDTCSLDLNLVMHTCTTHALYDAIIYLHNHAFIDYITPIHDLLPVLHDALQSGRDLNGKEVELGNKLLVYLSCCLAGRGYPHGDVPKDLVQTVKHDVYTCITCIHSKNGGENEMPYPYLRTLLHFDTKELLNVVALAFTEPEFTTELGLTQRQRLVDILLHIMLDSNDFSASEVGTLFTFLARQLSRPNSGLTIPPDKFHPVFLYLTDANPSHREERQQTLLELLRAAGLQGFPKDELLARAKQANFLRVCEVIYEQCGQWDQVFQCYLEDPQRRPQVFSFLRNMCVLSRKPEQVSNLLDAVSSHMHQLLALDVNMTGHFVSKMMRDRLPALLAGFDSQQKLELLGSSIYSRREEGASDADADAEVFARYLPLFIELTATLTPSRTLATLNNYIQYADLDVMLDVVKACGHVEAQAFILERRGEFEKAFEVINNRIEEVEMEGGRDEEQFEQLDRLVRAAVGLVQRHISSSTSTTTSTSATTHLWTHLLNAVLSKKSLPTSEKTKLLQVILSESAGFSNPTAILDFLLRHAAYSGATFGDLRPLFTGMLEDSRYEETLSATTVRLVHGDVHTQLASAIRSGRRALRVPLAGRHCPVCQEPMSRTSRTQVMVLPCGHGPVHDKCFPGATGTTGAPGYQCPVCANTTVDKAPFPQVAKLQLAESRSGSRSPISQLQLNVKARPVQDLELLSNQANRHLHHLLY